MTNALVGGGVLIAVIALAILLIKSMAKQAGRDEVIRDLTGKSNADLEKMLNAEQSRDRRDAIRRLLDERRRI